MSKPLETIDFAWRDLRALEPDALFNTRQAYSTLVTSYETPAIKMAEDAAFAKADIVLVIDTEKQICGVISPFVVRDVISSLLKAQYTTLYAAVKELEDQPEDIKERMRERLITERAKLRVCPGSGGHVTSENPCSVHGM